MRTEESTSGTPKTTNLLIIHRCKWVLVNIRNTQLKHINIFKPKIIPILIQDSNARSILVNIFAETLLSKL